MEITVRKIEEKTFTPFEVVLRFTTQEEVKDFLRDHDDQVTNHNDLLLSSNIEEYSELDAPHNQIAQAVKFGGNS